MAAMLVALLVIFGSIFGYKWLEIKLTADYLATYQPPPVAISATEVVEQVWDRKLRATGSTVAISQVDVSSEADGVISGIHFDSGDAVNQGDLLIELDDHVERASLKSYQARLNLASLNYERDRQMLSKKLISTEQLDRSKAELDEIRALVEQTLAIISQKKVRAPFAGQLGIRHVSKGQYLAAGTSAVSLQALNPLFVDFSLPEQHLPHIHIGQALSFTIKAYPGQSFAATVSAIDARVNERTRNIAIRAEAPNHDGQLLPGMFADVLLNLGADQPRLVVPETAITYSLYGQAVFEIIEQDGADGETELIVERRPVEAGNVQTGLVQIDGELSPGARIVINGQNKLQSGMRVKIVNRDPQTASNPLTANDTAMDSQ